jgi:hypothetical protein
MFVFLGLIGLLLITVSYVALHWYATVAIQVAWRSGHATALRQHARVATRSASFETLRFLRRQLKAWSSGRIWLTLTLQVLLFAALAYFILQALHWMWLSALLTGYVFLVVALTLSLLASLPFARVLWDDIITRLALLFAPFVIGFFVRGYASVWIGELLGTSAANTSNALSAASALLICVAVALLLGVAVLVFEVALLFIPFSKGKRGIDLRSIGLALLIVSSFVSTLAAFEATLQIPSSRLGNLLLSAIIFEFDASPAMPCELSQAERVQAYGNDPVLKVLHLSSSQEKGLLLQRSETLFHPIVLKYLKPAPDNAPHVRTVRWVECYKLR